MKLWDTFWRLFSGRQLDNPDEGAQETGANVRVVRTDANVAVDDDRAMQLSAVWACARLLVQSMATLPLHVFSKDSLGNREAVPDSNAMARLLRRRPNANMNAKEWRQAMALQRVLWGNAYAEIARDRFGTPVALIPLKPAGVRVYREKGATRYEYGNGQTGGERRIFYNRAGEPAQVFHWKGFSVDGVVGLSPLAYAREAMGVAVAADGKAARAFTGRPNGVIETDQFLQPEQRDKIRDLYGRMGTAETGDSQWWLLEGGFKYKQIGLPPDDLQMLESRNFQVAEIARFYGVPVVMIDGNSGSASAWPASYEQQVLSFLTFTLKPYLEEFEEKCIEVLGDGDTYAEHSVEGLLRADSTARSNFYAQALQNGWMSRNEVRQKENMPTVDGLDDYTVQVNLTPANDLGRNNDSEPTPQPAR